MKITEKKLRQIIREEKMKLQGPPLQEALEGVAFYEQKVDLLVTAQQHLDEASSPSPKWSTSTLPPRPARTLMCRAPTVTLRRPASSSVISSRPPRRWSRWAGDIV
jgi:hypothetical protein